MTTHRGPLGWLDRFLGQDEAVPQGQACVTPVQYPLHQRTNPILPSTRPFNKWRREHPDAQSRYRPTTGAMPPVTRQTDEMAPVQYVHPVWLEQLLKQPQAQSVEPAQEQFTPDWLTAPMPPKDAVHRLDINMLPEAIKQQTPVDPEDTMEVRAIMRLKYSEKGH